MNELEKIRFAHDNLFTVNHAGVAGYVVHSDFLRSLENIKTLWLEKGLLDIDSLFRQLGWM